eukprot:gene13728-29194_t
MSFITVQLLSCVFVVGGGLLCYLPVFWGLKLHINDQTNSSALALSETKPSAQFMYCLVGCIGATIPVLFDFALDSFGQSTRHLHNAKSAVWLLILSSFATNTFVFAFIAPDFRIEYWSSTICCKILLNLISMQVIMNAYGPNIWKSKYIFTLVITSSISLVLKSFLSFDVPNIKTLEMTQTIFQIISTIGSMLLGLQWIRYII